MSKIDIDQIREYEANGLIRIQKHPETELFIANYTQKVQFDKLWDEITLMCRGIIFDGEGNIIARPFKKFFNMGESWQKDTPPPPLPDEPFEITEKLDGSMGILYWYYDLPYIATRGSFTSEQALEGTRMLRIPEYEASTFPKEYTFLFEIVYTNNRIVVDYKGVENLYLLSIIDNETGVDLPLPTTFPFPIVRKFEGISGIEQLMAEYEGHDNFEGFVLRFTESNTRLKVKLPEYVRLHKLLTGINDRRIWELLAAGQSLEPILERVPDEFFQYVKDTEMQLKAKFEAVLIVAQDEFFRIHQQIGVNDCSKFDKKEWRKQFALEAMKNKEISGILFQLLDIRDPSETIWKMIKPESLSPWKVES